MLSSVSPTFVIVWLLANTLLFFLVTHFWDWLSKIQLSVLILLGYSLVCFISSIFIAKWFGVDEDKRFIFCLLYMVFLLFIHIQYYEYDKAN